jgi:hypothetical protein
MPPRTVELAVLHHLLQRLPLPLRPPPRRLHRRRVLALLRLSPEHKGAGAGIIPAVEDDTGGGQPVAARAARLLVEE